MIVNTNALGQPIGEAVPDWRPAAKPPHRSMEGRYCRVEPLDAEAHAADLFAAFQEDRESRIWTYLPYGPFDDLPSFAAWAREMSGRDDPQFHAIIDLETGLPTGVASYLRIQDTFGVIEVGHINYAPRLQRTRAATEAMYLMMARVFDELGNRRYEWKCDALNEGSRRAAERLGFSYEGTFRQALMYKGRNRDTAWYAIIDKDWPVIKSAYEAWLAPENFDGSGRQRTPLDVRGALSG